MKLERAQEIAQSLNRITGFAIENGKEPTWDELQEFSALALRATDPEYVMVPREKIQQCQDKLTVEPDDADADWFDERDVMLIDEMNRWLGSQEEQE